MERLSICVCGGGALGHVIAGYVAAQTNCEVNVLTSKPHLWDKEIEIVDCNKQTFRGRLSVVSSNPEKVIPQSSIILLCLPGFAIEEELNKIKDYIGSDKFVGSVVSSTGFFFMSKYILPERTQLFGFQRVPFIARVNEYGKSACLLGYKQSLKVATLNIKNSTYLSETLSSLLNTPINMLDNYLEASLSNSNPLLHTVRLYDLFKDYKDEVVYNQHFLFYKEWSLEASELLIKCDEEFQELLNILPVNKQEITPLLTHYESSDALSLTEKIRSIKAFKELKSPMLKIGDNSFIPDFKSRYFVEDFPYGLAIIKYISESNKLNTPNIDVVYNWSRRILGKDVFNTLIAKLFSNENKFWL